jgi:GTP-binding protein
MSKKIPIVAIVGRANVGKSSLFNAIFEQRVAIIADEPGTTRDSISAKASMTVKGERQDFWLVDTAGIKDPVDDFEFSIQEQILQAADSADVIWVVVEANVIITEEDRRVARLALKSGKPVCLVINKIDKARKMDISLFQRLGITQMVKISATHREGIDELLQKFSDLVPEMGTSDPASDRLKIALLGRPNAGKSALFNTLAKKQQAVVSDRAGTTRDVNRTVVRYQGREIELLDTAGIRRSGKIGQGVERFSVIRALAAIEEADICFVLMDANELNVQLDQKIAGMVKESGKGLVLVISKWDSLEKTAHTRDELAPEIAHSFDFVPWAPLIFTSSVSGQNVTKLFDLALQIAAERIKRVKTTELNRWLRQMADRHPPAGLKNRAPKLNYMVQEDDNPIPAFKIFGSHTKFVHWSYRRYLERGLREAYGFEGTAIQLWFIEKHLTHKHGESPTLGGKFRPPRKVL